jgi:Domain of unknown function (DUF4159)
VKSLVAAIVLVVGAFASIVGTLRADVTADQVRQAIDRGVTFLKNQQQADGSWSDANLMAMPGGISALCTLALLNCGVEPDDDAMQRALEHLRELRSNRTYVVSLQTMVFARAEPKKDILSIHNNVSWLERTQIRRSDPDNWFVGAWTYPGMPMVGTDGDNSNSQFALLALYEAERVGVSASDETWVRAKKYWERCQNNDGSWGYTRLNPLGTGSMTCAGITSLVIAADRVQSSDARVAGNRIECCVPHNARAVELIDRGMQWLGKYYSVAHNPGPSDINTLYYLYGLERVGRLTARRFIPLPARPGQPNRADWYREGAEHLVHTQDTVFGSWSSRGGGESNRVIGTCYALLFLSKGRWPVLLDKLEHGPADDWNCHRSDVANLTRYVERKWKRDMTWQASDLRLASVEDLLQTPVLYLCGSQDPVPEGPAKRKELAQKLRDYLDRGGFLFAEAYCGGERGEEFDKGFRELMQEAFPEPEYKLRLLEPEHPIWYAEEKIDPSQLRPLWGIEFGCRTSVVYVSPDPPQNPRPALSCLWELSRPGRNQKYSRPVQAQIDAALSLGLNVLAYATNRELKPKEDYFKASAPAGPRDHSERGRLYVATLRHPGGCNVAPRAVVNLMDAAAAQLRIRTKVRDQLLDITDDALFDYHLVFMHGRTAFHLTDAERQRLKLYIERGGTLLADSICASRAFTESFRHEMATIFRDHKLERIPVSDPLLSTTYGGSDLRIVSRRDPAPRLASGGPLEAPPKKVPPDLEGVKFGDRWGVIFSQYDLSCALEKRDSLECRGYIREDAARIGLNVVLYSLQQ